MASRNLALALQPPVRTIDDMFEDVARREPTFGGLYFDKGRLHVVLTDVGRDPEIVRTAIRGVFADARFSRAPIQVEPGRYSYSQLGAWGRQLPRAFGVPGVISIDVDEVRNRLAIGIRSDSVRSGVVGILAAAGVPTDALVFDLREPIHFADDLGGEVREIVGGVHIDLPAAGNWCTLGLNVSYSSQASFMTNGHCSTTFGSSNDGTPFWQAFRSVSADSVGSEGTEAALFASDHDARCPSSSAICKYSDADFIPYRSGMVSSQAMGYFARPTTRTRFDSNLVISSGTPTIPIDSKELFPFSGDTVDKVGARTGWTYGPVTSTCSTEAVTNGLSTYYFVCVHEANMGLGPGDSGSGVFVFESGTGYGTWAGQAFAGSTPGTNGFYTYCIFAPLNNIHPSSARFPRPSTARDGRT
jgi:hypothetical protein